MKLHPLQLKTARNRKRDIKKFIHVHADNAVSQQSFKRKKTQGIAAYRFFGSACCLCYVYFCNIPTSNNPRDWNPQLGLQLHQFELLTQNVAAPDKLCAEHRARNTFSSGLFDATLPTCFEVGSVFMPCSVVHSSLSTCQATRRSGPGDGGGRGSYSLGNSCRHAEVKKSSHLD